MLEHNVPLVVGEKRRRAPPDGDDGRFVPGEEQCHCETGDLFVFDAGGRAERGDDVVTGVGAFLGDEVLTVGEQRGQPRSERTRSRTLATSWVHPRNWARSA